MERKIIEPIKATEAGQGLTHWSRTPFDMTPSCGSKGDEWREAPEFRAYTIGGVERQMRTAVSCYKCQRKHGR